MNFKSIKRKSIERLVETELLDSAHYLPLVIKPAVDGVDLIAWATSNRNWIEAKLLEHGGLIFRNFQMKEQANFEHFIGSISGELLEYSYRSTPRSLVRGKIYTSTEYPAEYSIPLHNEMSYSLDWPMKIWFFCVKNSKGGETPIADSRKVFERIDPKIREKFIERKIMYVRNYRPGLDLEWQNVFQTNNKSEVETYCRNAKIDFEWKDDFHLRTRQICQAVATHPQTGDLIWFNQAHLFHLSSLRYAQGQVAFRASQVRESLLSMLKKEDLPRNAFYGDGSTIEDSIIQKINEIYQQESITFAWQENDILMLDNMLVAHGRNPFIGSRKILVGMAEPFSQKINSNN